RRHVRLAAEQDRPGWARLDASGLPSNGDAVRAQGAFVRLTIDRIDAGNVERAPRDAIATANAVLADEVDDAVGVLHDRARRGACLQAARVLAMHAAVLADHPFEVAFLALPFGEHHPRPRVGTESVRIVGGAVETPDVVTQVVPFHAGGLAGLTTDAAADIDQLGNLLLMIADRRRREGRGRRADVVLGLQLSHRAFLQATGASIFSTLTRNALNSGVS